ADGNSVGVVVVAAVLSGAAIGAANAVLISGDSIEDSSNLLLDSLLADGAGNNIHLGCNSVRNGVAVLLLSIQQGAGLADVPQIAESAIAQGGNANLVVQNSTHIRSNPNQNVRVNVIRHDIHNAGILDSVLQSCIQLSAVSKSNISGLVDQCIDVSGNAGSRSRGLVGSDSASGGAASQHADSQSTSHSQRSNLLELHNEFFLLMVYKR